MRNSEQDLTVQACNWHTRWIYAKDLLATQGIRKTFLGVSELNICNKSNRRKVNIPCPYFEHSNYIGSFLQKLLSWFDISSTLQGFCCCFKPHYVIVTVRLPNILSIVFVFKNMTFYTNINNK